MIKNFYPPFNRKIINVIGLLPEEYFMYYEDVDWTTSALLSNINLLVNKEAIIYHKAIKKLPLYTKIRSNFN